jgi:hypothetical protein
VVVGVRRQLDLIKGGRNPTQSISHFDADNIASVLDVASVLHV